MTGWPVRAAIWLLAILLASALHLALIWLASGDRVRLAMAPAPTETEIVIDGAGTVAPEPEPEPQPEPQPDAATTDSGEATELYLPPEAGPETEARASGTRLSFLPDETAPATPEATAPLAPPAPLDPREDPVRRAALESAIAMLRDFDGGPCFAAVPVLLGDGSLALDTFGTTGGVAFATALRDAATEAVSLTDHPASEAQCRAIAAFRSAPFYPGNGLTLRLGNTGLTSGGILSGEISGAQRAALHLLLIDEAGGVQSLAPFIRPRGHDAGFRLILSVEGQSATARYLLLAVAGQVPDLHDGDLAAALATLSRGEVTDMTAAGFTLVP
jgi:hypothetical protein